MLWDTGAALGPRAALRHASAISSARLGHLLKHMRRLQREVHDTHRSCRFGDVFDSTDTVASVQRTVDYVIDSIEAV